MMKKKNTSGKKKEMFSKSCLVTKFPSLDFEFEKDVRKYFKKNLH